tara:strand:+ start:1888 stop:2532 length:645 start_codon:yes stop_codon:yes gene_type:complete
MQFQPKSLNNLNHSTDEKREFQFSNDLECWQAFKRGNEAAFIHIYKQYFKRLLDYSAQYTVNKELVLDCIQDIFVELRKNRKNLSDTNSILKYLLISLKRKIIYRLNQAKSLDLRHQKVERFEIEYSAEDYIVNRQISEERNDRIKHAISQLSERQREAIYCFYYQNMNYKDVADVMDLSSTKSARNLIYKALGKLKISLVVDVFALIYMIHFV